MGDRWDYPEAHRRALARHLAPRPLTDAFHALFDRVVAIHGGPVQIRTLTVRGTPAGPGAKTRGAALMPSVFYRATAGYAKANGRTPEDALRLLIDRTR